MASRTRRFSARRRSAPTHSSFRPDLEKLEDRSLMSHGTTPVPVMLDDDLAVRTVVGGLTTPTSMAFLGANDFLVLEKNTGQVLRVVDGAVQGTVLDLGVNFASERGLLSIALHPNFPTNPGVYLYWTAIGDPPDPADPFTPAQTLPDDADMFAADTDDVLAVPLLGNRVDRFTWDASAGMGLGALTFDHNLLNLRAFQNDGGPAPPDQGDAGQPPLGNHDGGVIRFGADGKLYVIIGDVGRRGQLQNLPSGPTDTGLGTPVDDDQFGGPEPDDAHFTGVIIRINDDGTTPTDNPFFDVGAQMGGEVGANIQLIYAYGLRNSFGLTIDPFTGNVWYTENGDDSFDEINFAFPGHNSGWIQTMGPLSRLAEFKQIETTFGDGQLQQLRWPPDNLADSPTEALARMFQLPGSAYSDPEFSWRFAVPPTALSFVASRALGREFFRDLIVGNGAGQLMDFNLTGGRRRFVLTGALADRVDDNFAKFVPRESRPLIIGQGFGIITDLQNSPRGSMYVVSHTQGVIYEVFRRRSREFVTRLTGAQEVPPRDTRARGLARFTLSADGTELRFRVEVSAIRNVVAAHLHLGAPGENGPIVVSLFMAPPGGGRTSGILARGTITADDLEGPLEGHSLDDLLAEILAGNVYINVHTNDGVGDPNTGPGDFPGGEIRGQLRPVARRR